MANLSEDIQCTGSDTRPPMLDSTEFASLNEGALHLGLEQPCVYSDLSPEDKDRYNADIQATNILLQGLPKYIYSLIDHYTDAKDIWDNVKMLLEGLELTKEDRESQLYDDSEHFRQHKGETIHDYYVRFAKLINDMRILKMTHVPESSLNSKTSTNPRNQATVQDGRVVVKNVQGQQNRGQGNNAQGAGTAGNGGAQIRVGNSNPSQARQENGGNNRRKVTIFHAQVDYTTNAVAEMWMSNHVQDLALNVDEYPVYDEAGSSYDSDILFEKENKYLEEFLDMKALKEKVEDRLYKQDQSLQTVHMLCKPKPYYNELNKVAIGYKNPLCLTRAKQVQPALYNGYEIVKNNHVPAIVHNTEDTLEIAEITRRKMHDKMKDPECVTHKVKIAPPDYSKENYLATFTPQKQLTPEQIFWSQDIIKMKAEALKEQTTASRPTKALTVYPPNTPATLVPRVLPTKNVFHVATNSELKVSSFTEMYDAHTSLKVRCLELEVELSDLLDKIQKDNHDELLKWYAIDVEQIPPRSRNNREVHLDYLKYRVNSCTDASRSKPKSNTKKNRISPAKSVNKKKVEAHLRTNKSNLKSTNYVDSSISSKRTVINSNSHSVCKTFMEVWKPKQVKQVWKATGKVLTNVGYNGSPLKNIFTIGEQYPLTRLITSNALPVQQGENAARTMLIFSKALIFHTRHNKTPYELVHDKKPDLTFLRVFGALCYPTNDSEDLGKFKSQKAKLQSNTLNIPVLSAGIPSSTTIDQDAPSPSHSPSSLELQPPISHQGVAAGSTIIEDNPFAHADNVPFVNMFSLKPSSEASSFGDVSSAKSTHVTQPHNNLKK
ncbi:hypothetical protein Tco_1091345 [Tanacetum coccineum]|uniref:Retrovirus-related Pol polyprotein from transposon TNT 1-94 n=1 Tax=Tanacetum coccineum TaxID=301880 RepID=A0ABQ5I954_9ASTR